MSNASMVFIFTLAVLALGTSPVYGEPIEIILLTNSVDYALAQDFIDSMKNNGFEVTRVEAADFDAYKTRQFIVILGGPDAPEGIGNIVQQHLSSSEQEHLRVSGSREMYLKAYQSQRVFIIAGSDRAQTQLAHVENMDSLYEQVTAAESPPITPPSPLPTGSKTIYAGEYVESISYWGYTKSGGYTTVKIQGKYQKLEVGRSIQGNTTIHQYEPYPLAYITFRDSELPIKFRLDDVEYEILYYNNEKVIVKKL